MLTGMVGSDLIQPGPGGVSAAKLAFHVLLAGPLDDRPPTNTPHIDVHESDVTSSTSSEGCGLTTLFTTPRSFSLSVSNTWRSKSVNVLVGDDPGDLFTAGIDDTLYALFEGGENHVGREDEFVSFPECGSGREWRRTRVGGVLGRSEAPLFSSPWWHVRGNAASGRAGVLWFRFLFSSNGFLDQAVDDLDGLCADFDRFAANGMGLGQSRAGL